MATINIDGKEYDLDSLPENAKSQLIMLQAAENELRQLQQKAAIVQTARNAYAQALKAELEKTDATDTQTAAAMEDSGTIQF
jgi:hypothetical protein